MHETHCESPASFKKVSEIRRTDGRERTHEIRFWICTQLGTLTDFLEWRAERSKHIHENPRRQSSLGAGVEAESQAQ